MRKQSINDDDRRQWVQNDEGLYDMWRRSHKPIRTWIRDNRTTIDAVINNVSQNKKPQHYLKYGG